MSEESLNNILYSKNVIEFVTVAGEYCHFLESLGNSKMKDFLDKGQKILPLLYLKAAMLPEFETVLEEMPEKFVSELDYNIIQQKVIKITGEHDDYQEVFDSGMQFSEEAITSSISENLSDIYQDLKDFVSLYQIGNEQAMEEGLWECRNNFGQYWGQKLVNSLRAIHNLAYSDIDFEEDESKLSVKQDSFQEKPDWLNQKFNNREE